MSKTDSTEVVIIGAGPTGLTLALLLAKTNVRCCVVEQNAGPQPHPAACILNTRTMEIFREMEIAEDVLKQAQNAEQRSNIVWVSSLAGRQLGCLNAAPNDLEQARTLSPVSTTVFPQNRLEPLLWKRAERDPLIRIISGHRLVAIDEASDQIAAKFRCNSDLHGSNSVLSMTARYLVGCDGASSDTRKLMSMGFSGDVLQSMLSIYFTADLQRYVEGRPGILYWVFNRHLLGVLIAHWLPTEWVLMTPYFPPQESRDDFDAVRCGALISSAIGDTSLPFRINHVGTWALSARMADTFRKRRVFLAGDAAHAFPPTGGLGLNTGVQDAHNLAWKLHFVLRGTASPELLDSYEDERRPVAAANLAHSVQNYFNMDTLIQPAGLRLADLQRLVQLQNSQIFQALPQKIQRWCLRAATNLRLRRLRVFAAAGKRGDEARQSLQRQLPGQKAHYCFLGLDLGFAYRSSAIFSESRPQPLASDPISDYRPTTWPGSRLPHCWFDQNGNVVSSLDLVRHGGFQLIVRDEYCDVWEAAVSRLRREFQWPIGCTCISLPSFLPSKHSGSTADNRVRQKSLEDDLQVVFDDDNRWGLLSEVDTGGAVLVRPDGHVAWRTGHLPTDPFERLGKVMSHLLDARTRAVET